MSETQGRFQDLMRRIRAGSQEAAQELFDVYGPHILRVVRDKLAKKLRSKFDSTDFEQAVWASFFAQPAEQYNFDGPEALIAFLGKMASNKVADTARQRLIYEKYNVNREHSMGSSTVRREGEPVSADPSPSRVAAARDEWEHLVNTQPGLGRRILDLLCEGKNRPEIARELGINEKTVRRLITKIALGELS